MNPAKTEVMLVGKGDIKEALSPLVLDGVDLAFAQQAKSFQVFTDPAL